MAQALVAVVLGAATVLGVTTQVMSTPLWLAMAGLALVGARASWRIDGAAGGTNASRRGPALVAAAALTVPTVVLLPYFVHGFGRYAGTAHQDAWVYIAFGDYLWHYPRLTNEHLAPIYQFASAFSNSRFASPAELGWLATVTREGDSQAAFGLLLTLNAFITGCAGGAVARAFKLSAPLTLLVSVTTGAGNWVSNAILAANLDSVLALSYLPALVALALVDRPDTPPGRAVPAGLLLAGATHTFPEFAPLVGVCAALHLAGAPRTSVSQRWRDLRVGTLVAVVLILPAAAHLAWFMWHELGVGLSRGARPAEGIFAGLIDVHRWPAAFWALGRESSDAPIAQTLEAAAAIVSLLFLAGLARLVADRRFATLVTLATLGTAFGIFAWGYDYGYGAYKFVLFGWWLLALTVAVGVRECRRLHAAVGYGAAIAATTLFASSAGHAVRESAAPPSPDIGAYRALGAIAPQAGGAPIALAVENIEAAHWASYFLRATETRLVSSVGAFTVPFAQPALARAAPIPWTSLRLLLTDTVDIGPFTEQASGWTQLWQSPHYTLWDTHDAGWAIVSSVDNGYPFAVGPGLVWIGDKGVTIRAAANRDGVMRVDAKLALSQTLSEAVPVRLATIDGQGDGCERRVAYAGFSLPLALHAGENTITVAKAAPTGIKVLPEADQRNPFMVALMNPTAAFERDAPIPICPP